MLAIKESPETNVIRSTERRIFFNSELLFKTAYAWALEKATRATYEVPEDKTWALIKKGSGKAIVSFPRYQDFTPATVAMAETDESFVNVAGNKKILLTVIVPRTWTYKGHGEIFTEWPILTEPQLKRDVLLLNVEDLAPFVHQIRADQSVKLDHIFDY